MNARVRSVLLGLGLGLAPVLLLDLAGTLRDAVQADPAGTSYWWVLACYLGAGVLAGLGLLAGVRDRLLAAVALVVLVLAVLPQAPVGGTDWLQRLPILPSGGSSLDVLGVGFVLVGAYGYVLVRGARR